MLIFEITTITSFPLNLKSTKPDNQPIARLITTLLTWEDLVINDEVLSRIKKVSERIRGVAPLQNNPVTGAAKQTGFRVLFSGRPGTGKTLTACLLGKVTGHDVYRVDLAEAVSKYKGEIIDELSRVFAMAADKQWLLYLDGTDALFGKQVTPGDKNANVQLAKLMQYLKTYPGVVIMSTTLADITDDASLPVFDLTVNFPMPDAQQRLRLWQTIFEITPLAPDVTLADIALENEVTGGDIINVLRYCALKTVKDGAKLTTLADIREGLQKELHK